MLLGWAIFVASACITAFYIFSTNNANAPKIKLEEIATFKSRSLVFSTTTEIAVKDSLINGSDIIRREPIVARGISSLSLVSDILSNMSKSSILDNVLINGEANDPSLFVTEDVQPGLSFLHELPNNWEYSIVEDSVNYSSFMSRGQEKHHHAFFNSDLSNFPQIESIVPWKGLRILEDLIRDANYTFDISSAFLWMIYGNSTLQARYSEYHTQRLQLAGSCRYYIFSSSDLGNLYFFPSIHVAQKQSQVDFSSFANIQRSFPKVLGSNVSMVTLKQGDVLYIPPFSTVLMDSSSDPISAGVDVISPSSLQLILAEALFMQLPMDSALFTTSLDRIAVAQMYLVHVLSRIHGVTSTKAVAQQLYKRRYAKLFPPDSLFFQKTTLECPYENNTLIQGVLERINQKLFVKSAEFVAKCANDRLLTPIIRSNFVDDYVEQVARWAVGDANLVPIFLLNCLKFSKNLKIIEEVEGPKTVQFTGENAEEL